MKILAPVDGSPASLRAVKLAIELAAGRQQTSIVLLNVQNIPMLTLTESARAVMAVWLEEEEERTSAEALREAARACEAAGAVFTVRVERGPPAAVIHKIAGEEKANHIIMGTRGLGGIRGLLLHSGAALGRRRACHSGEVVVRLRTATVRSRMARGLLELASKQPPAPP
jgi:nucleotide-binding universal stress UspA family protein